MNRVYKVIFNRRRQLVQVVPEYARNRGKTVSESRKGGIRGLAKVLLTFLATLMIASPGYAADGTGESTGSGDTTATTDTAKQVVVAQGDRITVTPSTDTTNNTITYTISANGDGTITADDTNLVSGGTVYKAVNGLQTTIGSLTTNGNYITTSNSVSANLSALDTQVKRNAGAIGTNTSNITNNTNAISAETKARTDADTSLRNKIGTLDANGNYIQKDASVSSNLSTLDTQMKANADAISTETSNREKAVSDEATARTNAINALETKLTSGGSNSLVSKANVDASNIGTKIDTSSETTEEAKKKKQEDNAKLWGEALGIGTIADGNEELLTGGTLYTELRPSADGSYIYNGKSTAYNLLALDSAINALGVEKVTDNSGNITYVSNLYKYFKANPETTTNDDGTVTYATDADAQGTNSVAIGPSAKVNTTGENGVAIGKVATTGADKYTKTLTDKTTTEVPAAGGVDSVAIGTNAASQGNDSVALGKGAQVLNDFNTSTNAAVVKTGDVAIGSGATVDSSLNSTAIGTSADVRYGEDSLALGSSAKVDTAKQAVALGYKASVADGADGSLALGDEASAKSSYATAIGYKASANTASSIAMGNGANTGGDGGGIAIGTSATADGRSIAIGFSGTTTANNYDSVAIGNGAQANVDRSISIGLNAGTGAKADKGGNEGSLIAIGDAAGQNVAGLQNTAIGSGAGSGVKSSNNIALGSYAGSNITNVSDNNPQNGYNISIGYQANYSKTNQTIIDSLAIGRGTSAITNGVALGATAKASGQNSVSLGFNAQSSGTDSMALGSGASAADGNVAIGSSSAAPAVSTLGTVRDDGNVYKAETSTDSSGAVTTTYTLYKSALTNIPLSSTSHYVSFGISDGNTTVNRRLSNVADGVFDQDAVTVKQLNTAYSSLQGLIKGIDTSTLNTYSTDVIDSKEANLKAEIANSKYKYFSVNADSATSTGNQDNTGASSGGADAMAIGPNAYATATKSLAVGNNVSASGVHSIALGTSDNPTTTAGATTTHYTSSEGENSIAVGYAAIAQTDNSIAIGTRAVTYTADTSSKTPTKTGINSIAIGYETVTRKDYATAIGNSASAKGTESTALGNKTTAVGTESLAVGSQSTTNGDGSASIGRSNAVTGTDVAAVGSGNISSGNWGGITDSGLFGYTNKIQAYSDTNVSNTVTGVYALGSNNEVDQANKINKVTNVTLLGQSNIVTAGSNATSYQNTINNVTVIGGSNTVKGYEQSTTSWSTLENDTVLGYGNTIDASQQATPVSNIQILGNKVTATLGNSVYLGAGAAYVSAAAASNDAETLAVQQGDAEAEVSDEYKAATTDTERNTIRQKYEAKYLYKARVAAMEASGTTAGVNQYDQDNTYGNASSYTYAAGTPTGVVTVGSVGSERRIQNVAAGLVSASSTDAVNGSQLYALTRQLRFGGDNSSFGTTTADDKEVVARGSNEALYIIGGEKDTTKLTDSNIGVVSDGKDTLTVKLSKNVNLGNDGSVVTGNATLDNTGLTITHGPKFTSNGIDAASQQIKNVTAGTDDTSAANVGQVKAAAAEATTEVKAGTNASLGTVETSTADKHKIYTVNVDNLAVKANGTGTTTVALAKGINFKNGTNTTSAVDSNGNVTIDTKNLVLKANGTNTATVTMDNGINFKNGTNTTATVGADGTVTISATHNKLDSASYTASKPSDSSNQTTVKLKDTDGNETTLNLTDTYTTVSKNTDHTIAFKRNDGSDPVSVSLDDLNGASKEALTTAAAKATTTVIEGSNVDSVDDTTSADGHHIYKVNVSNLGVKVADGQKKSVALSDGLVFGNGTNTTASVGDNGAITFNVSDATIKTKAKDAIDVVKGNDNVTVDTTTSTDGTKKTFTISAKDTYTTVTRNADEKTVTFTRNDGQSQTVRLSDLGGITAAQDKYITGGTVSYDTNGNGTAAITGTNGITASITGLKDTKVSSGAATYAGTQGDASGSATLTMNDGTKAAITGLKDDYITSASVGTETNHVTMTRLGGGTVDLNLNPILEKYSLSDYRLVGNGDSQDQAYQVNADGTVTLNVVDAKNAANKKTIQITGLASQSGVNAGRTTVKSSDSSVIVNDGTSNSDTHTYDIKVDYSKIPANLTVQYSGDNGTSGSNTMDKATAFSGTANQIVTKAENGKVTFKLADNISGIQSVTTGNAKLDTNGLTITDGPSVLKTGINGGGKTISNVADAAQDTDAATLKQVKNARTVVAKGNNVKDVTPVESTDGTHQVTYTVNVDNLSVKANKEAAKSVTLKNGLTFNNGTNTTATVGDNGEVKYDLNPTLTGLTSVTAGNSALDSNGLTIKEGTNTKVAITGGNVTMGGNVIHNVGAGVAPTDAVNKGQLEALQTQVSGGWNLAGKNSDGTAVTAQIGAGKTVTYTDGTYTKAVVTKDDNNNATVNVDVTTGAFGSGTGDKAGTVTSEANGLATTQDVANAINSASISVVADNTPENKTAVKAGDTIHFAKAKDDNLTLTQNGTTFTYGLNKEISISKVTTSDTTKGSTVQTAEGVATTDAAGNTYIQNGQGITLTSSDKTKSPVKLTNTGLDNGGNKITGVGKGTDDTDAVNVAQLKEVNDKVGSGWQLAGNDGQKVADIGAGRKVSFKTDSQYLTAKTESAGTDEANVAYGLKTKTLTAADGKVSSVETAEDGLATAKNVADTINQTYWTAASGKSGSGSQTDETANDADKKISAGDTVTFNAGNNLSLVQNGASFTYGLQADMTGMNTITFTPRTDDKGHPISLVIGKQKDGVNTDEGYYITGLDNTTWNQSNYVKDRAATEAQLASAIQQVTLASQSGGFKLSDDQNQEVSQVLGQAIGVVGDGNITTVAETTTADTNGHIKVRLNKDIDLGTDGSLQAGGVTLKNNSVTVGTDGVVISSSGTDRTVSNLSNTQWVTAKANQEASAGGYIGSTKAATESQLQQAISQVTTTAQNNEQHIQTGEYTIGKNTDGTDRTDTHSVSMDVVDGQGKKQGSVVIKDVAKASEVGDVSQLHDNLSNPDGTKNVTGAINNLDTRVTGLDTQMKNIYTTAGQHSSVSAEDNIQVDSQSKNGTGGTDYKLSLNKEKIDLKNVTIEGNAGAVTAKTVTAEKYNVGDKTYISSDGLNANSQKITNVQAGTADTDAANVGQVRAADEQLAGGIEQNARNITQLSRDVDKLDSRIDRVGAGAAALAALHPGTYDPKDKVDFSAGYGNYRGASAAAVGMYYHPDERTILSMGVAMGGGENMVNAGVTWKLGRRTPVAPQPVPVKTAPAAPALVPVSTAAAAPVRPAETAPVVKSAVVQTAVRPVETAAPVAPAPVRLVQPAPALQPAPVKLADSNAQLMDLLARQTAILEKLAEQKAAPAAAPKVSGDDLFTDVPENHWAYACALKLEQAGALKGLNGLQVAGNPLLTRKDFAKILYTALKNGATTNPALNQDGSLNRMASEFRAELKEVKG
ncbi:ESPR-type extended signal peptide-containing protein [Acidaminococcus fermentans]|uniref:ESPR-type extended signal peptide-containing protein n=1 Tax=Acidaminococcus fermentans TaxID=905 RepID=UPI0024329B3A|nr:ESPR-type extended signal peptide-containing protein [Acidaminococcus fermentans]